MFLGPKCLNTISVIHLADQPCTSTSSEIARDTVSAFLDRPFAEGKCNFMFYWHLWNVNTPVGLQSLINTCHVNSMSHVTEDLDLHADVYHLVHQSCRLKNAYKAKKRNKQLLLVQWAHVVTRSATGMFYFNDMFLLCSVCHRLWQSRNKTVYDWARVWWSHEGISSKTWQWHLVLRRFLGG